ncbi:chaplin [Spiractinospora alimapuensis]|uniref:chaplin family protein n=1 Tax=Spiractinospora alimapuensis TaxID=2820884 RepID=UPI001F3A928D|nr:chaplin family protein [Spiractinospora alimapuensis]QVQ50958.1 chaplin [Spiractinospora alimapuensis]
MLKKFLAAGAVSAAAAGVVLMSGGTAYAHTGDNISTSGVGAIVSGNQAVADIDIPVNVCGNSVAILGIAGASCDKGSASSH